MEVYTLETYINNLNFFKESGFSNLNQKKLRIVVNCGDLIQFDIKYLKASTMNVRGAGSGMVVIFPSTRTNIIEDVGKHFKLNVYKGLADQDKIGSSTITWKSDFLTKVKDFDVSKNSNNIEIKDTYSLVNSANNKIGQVTLQAFLAFYGPSLQTPINGLGSQLNIPLPYRIKEKSVKSEIVEAQAPWAPLFVAPKKQARSLVDEGMQIFAELAGIIPPPPISSLLTPTYINKHICGRDNCPAAKKFKDFGLGPLSQEGYGLGTVTSIAEAKPCGIYGLSQTYGTMESYGAYGLFVKRKENRKTVCGSPDCPYTAFYEGPDLSTFQIRQIFNKKAKKCVCKSCRKCIKRYMEEPYKILTEEEKQEEEKKQAEEQKLAAERQIAEKKKLAAERKLAEQKKLAEEKKRAEEEKLAEEENQIEEMEEATEVEELSPFDKTYLNFIPMSADEICSCKLNKFVFDDTLEFFKPAPRCAYINNGKRNSRQAAGFDKYTPDIGCPHLKEPTPKPADTDNKYPDWYCHHKECPLSLKHYVNSARAGPLIRPSGAPKPAEPSLEKADTVIKNNRNSVEKTLCSTCNAQDKKSSVDKQRSSFDKQRSSIDKQRSSLDKQRLSLDKKQEKQRSSFDKTMCTSCNAHLEKTKKFNKYPQKQTCCKDPKCSNYIPDEYEAEGEGKPCCMRESCPERAKYENRKKSKRNSTETEGTDKEICCMDPTCPKRKQLENSNKSKRYSEAEEQPCCTNPNCPRTKQIEEKRKQKRYSTESAEGDGITKKPCCKEDICRTCKYATPKFSRQSAESAKDKQIKNMSVLANEEGDRLIISKDEEAGKELLASISFAQESDILYMLETLMSETEIEPSMINYYIPDMPSVPFDTPANLPEDPTIKVKKKKGPCTRDTCKKVKYKTCSECGGISRSGATCDNTDVSFSTISYDSSTSDSEIPADPPESSIKKPMTPTMTKAKKSKGTASDKVVKVQKQKKNSRFVYKAGEYYPGIKVGHKVCAKKGKSVPAHMGWLWNITDWKKKKTWKPGYLSNIINERIVQNRRAKGIPDPPELKFLVKKQKTKFHHAEDSEEDEFDEEDAEPKPTLKIQKKDGNYLITLNPLKDPKTTAENENPYIKCKPMQFLIIKPKKEHPSQAVKNYDEIGGELDSNVGDYEDQYYKKCLCDESEESSSSESELDIEFTTPAGLIVPERMKKMVNVVHTDTQFKQADFNCTDCDVIVPQKFKKDKRKGKK